MKLFWKIYFAIVVPLVVIASLCTYVIVTRELSDEEEHAIKANMLASRLITREIEKDYAELKWPFESLKSLSEGDDFLFWWIVSDNGTIYLSNDTSFIGTYAYTYFPQVRPIPTNEKSFLDKERECGVFIKSFGKQERWSFWLGFSTRQIAQTSRKIILSAIVSSALALAALGVILYLTINYFTKPINKLAEGAEIIGRGDLNHRVQIHSRDELGYLAHSFNEMAEHLEETTTSIDNLNREITERKKVEERLEVSRAELHEQNEFLNNILESLTHPFYVIDTNDYTIKMANSAAHFGKLGKDSTCYALTHKRSEPCTGDHSCPLAQVKKTKKPVTVEHIHYDKDGNPRNVEVHGYPILDRDGNISQMIEYCFDVTERKKAQERLEKLNKCFLSFGASSIENINSLTALCGELLGADCALYNRVADGMICSAGQWNTPPDYNPVDRPEGHICYDVIRQAKDDVFIVRNLPETAYAHTDPNVAAFGLKTYIGKAVKCHGDYVGSICAVYQNDITPSEDDKRMLGIVASAIGVEEEREKLVYDMGKRIKELRCIYGVTNSIQQRETLQEIFQDVVKFIPGGWQYPEVTRAKVRFDGEEYVSEPFEGTEWKQTSDIVVGGKHRGSVEVYYLEERRALVEGPFLKEERDLINGITRTLSQAIERRQIEQRQAELLDRVESANRELKDFAYVVSHDLKAPLRGIKTLADWISTDYADKLDEDGRDQISLMSSRVDRMHNLIEGILQYSRIGRVKEEKALVNLNELVPNIIDSLDPGENVAVTIENELPVIECEQTRIIQVFQNLLSNAIKYMDKAQGQIKIGSVEDDGFWKFSMADNGPGIEERHFEKIFQMFQTLSPRDEFESTGVGLTLIKKIVDSHGGKIWLESNVGEGSTFFFTLPKSEMGVKDAKLQANIVS